MTTIPGPATGYTDLLDAATTAKLTKDREDQKSGEKKGSFPLRPSSAGYCSRRLGYDLMSFRGKAQYEKEVFKPATHRLLNLGNSIEDHVLKQFYLFDDIRINYRQHMVSLFKLKPIDGKEQEIIEGSIDGTFWSQEHKAVFDIKSQKDGFHIAYKSRWDHTLAKYEECQFIDKIGESAYYVNDLEAYIDLLGGDWLVDNLVQLNSYACSQFFVDRGVDHAVIFKYNKNDSRHYELRFAPNEKLFKKLEDKYNRINVAVDKGDINAVSKDYVLGSSRCAFCSYSKECWGGADALKTYFRTFNKSWPDDLDRMPPLISDPLGKLFDKWESFDKVKDDKDRIEKDILKIMTDNKIERIKLPNKKVYKAKYLKTYGGFVIRKDKL